MEVNKTQDLQPASRYSVEPKWYGFKSKSKGSRTRTINGLSSSLSPSSKTSLPAWNKSGREREREGEFSLVQPFRSIQLFSGLGKAHPYSAGKQAWLSPAIQIFISSRNTFTDTPRNNVSPNIWASYSPVKLTHEINHHGLLHRWTLKPLC